MNVQKEIYLKLAANVIIDFLKHYSNEHNNVLFNEADCASYKSIRFSTRELDAEFKPIKKNIGYYKNGHFVYFEIKSENDIWIIELNISKVDLPYDYLIKLKNIEEHYIFENEYIASLFKKDLCTKDYTIEDIIINLTSFLQEDLYRLLNTIFQNKQSILKEEIEIDYNVDKYYIEGAKKLVFENKYERNTEARQKCIEHYGAKCQICGFDFAKVYGEEFEGKIEVHHRVPLSEIKKEYIVDPIKDLIPVCSNCHLILHSKPNGTYTVEEVIEIIEKRKK